MRKFTRFLRLWLLTFRREWFMLALIPNKDEGGGTMQAYCVKCRAKREMKDARQITMKNGKPATQGTCPVCGTKMFRIGKA
jgi:hypothetical protein